MKCEKYQHKQAFKEIIKYISVDFNTFPLFDLLHLMKHADFESKSDDLRG